MFMSAYGTQCLSVGYCFPSEKAMQNPTKLRVTTTILCEPSCHLNLKELQGLQEIANPPFFVFVAKIKKFSFLKK